MGSVDIGRIGEVMFISKCLERGIAVLSPELVCGYDFVIESNGVYKKVQVKATKTINSWKKNWVWDCRHTKSNESEVYAFIIVDMDLIFITTTEEVNNRKRVFRISKNNIFKSEWLNNWNLLTN